MVEDKSNKGTAKFQLTTLKMEAVYSSQMQIDFNQNSRRYISGDNTVYVQYKWGKRNAYRIGCKDLDIDGRIMLE
jgi:hypothetical protein